MEFKTLDIAHPSFQVPEGEWDLIILRDVLFHLPWVDSLHILDLIRSASDKHKARFFLSTSFWNEKNTREKHYQHPHLSPFFFFFLSSSLDLIISSDRQKKKKKDEVSVYGCFSEINLFRPPFDMPMPLHMLPEPNFPQRPERFVCLWTFPLDPRT